MHHNFERDQRVFSMQELDYEPTESLEQLHRATDALIKQTNISNQDQNAQLKSITCQSKLFATIRNSSDLLNMNDEICGVGRTAG